MNVFERLFADSKLGVHVLVCVFAISSWVDINGMWVELPILVTNLPEKWTLPSYLTILSQIANIGPIIFFAVAFFLSKSSVSKLKVDKAASYLIMLVGLTATMLLAFLWRRTAYVAGSERSVALMALSFFLALMDCTSSLAYVAFMASLKPTYLASFFIGEGLSGLLPAMMALGQGAGDIRCVNGSKTEEKNVSGVVTNVTSYYQYPMYVPPRFSVQLFFLLLSAMIGLSILAFTLLNHWRYCKDQFVVASMHELPDSINDETGRDAPFHSGQEQKHGELNPAFSDDQRKTVQLNDQDNSENCRVSSEAPGSVMSALGPFRTTSYGSNGPFAEQSGTDGSVSGPKSLAKKEAGYDGGLLMEMRRQGMSMGTMMLLLSQVYVINLLITSFLLSVQTYSSLPYGLSIYNLVVTLTNIANPVACIISMFLAITHPAAITCLTSLGVACSAYIIVAAILSPNSPMVGESAGGPVSVVIWVGASFFLTYGKVSVGGAMRQVGRKAMLAYGVTTQIGSLIGAIVGFILVNEAKVFKSASYC